MSMPSNSVALPGSIANSYPSQNVEIQPDPFGPWISLPPGEAWTASTNEEYYNALNSITTLGQRIPAATGAPQDPTLVASSNGNTHAETRAALDRGQIASGVAPDPYLFGPPYSGPLESPFTQTDSVFATWLGVDESGVGQFQHTRSRIGEEAHSSSAGGNTVDLSSGEFHLEETDLETPNSVWPLSFTRYYRSGTPSYGPFGYNWDHNHNIYLREIEGGVVTRWNGRVHEDRFFPSGLPGEFKAQRGVFEILSFLGPRTYEIKAPGGVIYRFSDPALLPSDMLGRIPLQEVEDRFGNKLIYDYKSVDGLYVVDSVTSDRDNRLLKFRYHEDGGCGLLEQLDDCITNPLDPPNPVVLRSIKYIHDIDIEHLVDVWFMDPTTDHPKGTHRRYQYLDIFENYPLRHNILAVIDGEGDYYAINDYDRDPSSPNYTKVVSQLFGDNQYLFEYAQLQVVPAGEDFIRVPSHQCKMTAPDGGQSVYTFNYRGDLLDHRMIITSVIGGSGVAITVYVYDAQGNLTQINDAAGKTTNIEYAYSDNIAFSVLLWGKRTLISITNGLETRSLWKGEYDTAATGFQDLLKEWDERALKAGVTTNDGLTVYHYSGVQLFKVTFPDVTLPQPPPPPSRTQSREVLIVQDSSTGRITKVTSPLGFVTEFDYGFSGTLPLQSITRDITISSTSVESFTYDVLGYLASHTDPTGATTDYTFNKQGQLELVLLPAISGVQASITNHYDRNGFVKSTETPKGDFSESGFSDTHLDTTYKYDIFGYPQVISVGANTNSPFIVRRKNSYKGVPTLEMLPNGTRSKHSYNERGQLIRTRTTGADGAMALVQATYNLIGQPLSTRFGPLQDQRTKHEYDWSGREEKRIYSAYTGGMSFDKGYLEIGYDWTDPLTPLYGPNCKIVTEEYKDGTTTDLMSRTERQYDERDRLILVRVWQTPTSITPIDTRFFYDAEDQLVKVIGPQGTVLNPQVLEYKYDGLGRLIQTIDPMLNIENRNYDLSARTVTVERIDQEPAGTSSRSWIEYYDERDRLIKLREPGNIDTLYEYDDRNLLVKTTLPTGIEVESSFGLMANKVSETIDPSGLNYVHEWEFDEVYQVKEYTDPSIQATQYAYDGLGRLVKRVLPGDFEFINEYGADGRVKSHTQPSGAKTSFQYDTFGRLSLFSATAGTSGSGVIHAISDHTYTYDALDRLLTADVASGPSVSRAYDSLGQLVSETNHGTTQTAAYDIVNGEITKEWDTGVTELHTLNLNGIANEIVRTVPTFAPDTLLIDLDMSGPAALGQATLRGLGILSHEYDDRRRLLRRYYTKAMANVKSEYRYDDQSRRSIERVQRPGFQEGRSYSFDNQSRLITSKLLTGTLPTLSTGLSQSQNNADIGLYLAATGTSTSTTYNSGDERVTHAGISYDYDPGHRLTDFGSDTATTYADGPFLTIDTMDFEIDALGRIIKIDSDVEIKFDALGRPSILIDGANPVRSFCYFGDALWFELADGDPDRYITHHAFAYGYFGVHIDGGASYLTINDARMNRLAVLNTSGTIAQAYWYDPFGIPIGSPATLEHQFGGMRYLPSKNIYLSRSRIYKPDLGLFLSADPLGYIDSQNLYAYVGHDPADFVDPFGWKRGDPPAERKGLPLYFAKDEAVVKPDPTTPTGSPSSASRSLLYGHDNLLQHLRPMPAQSDAMASYDKFDLSKIGPKKEEPSKLFPRTSLLQNVEQDVLRSKRPTQDDDIPDKRGVTNSMRLQAALGKSSAPKSEIGFKADFYVPSLPNDVFPSSDQFELDGGTAFGIDLALSTGEWLSEHNPNRPSKPFNHLSWIAPGLNALNSPTLAGSNQVLGTASKGFSSLAIALEFRTAFITGRSWNQRNHAFANGLAGVVGLVPGMQGVSFGYSLWDLKYGNQFFGTVPFSPPQIPLLGPKKRY